ncbi:hypothetical protein [Mumia zhuanghuii]|uniref:MinD-like ATPase involved in chromosome partitioning or flagellar assembly n=1 Tax=Mumia zhuanghuii TaxID=2585211 RepID=A0A5C4M0E1_9ACTN|nr:hypothetical protein [Mumia zhuanghuii]TNC25881.1 hypothetical protein FHE65_34790 [Mumia zhuanghuii]TNC40369.1 hypothetical protein FHE65_23445 [Mumia zhuanghuii]
MTVVAFASAKGSPGVTQTVAGLVSVWGGAPIMAELDPVGGDLAFRQLREDGVPLDRETGLLSYAVAVRGGRESSLTDHLQPTDEGIDALVGVTAPGQVQGLGLAWPHIATGLQAEARPVLADCGRLTPGTPIAPVVEQASALVLVARSDVAALAHLRERLLWLREPLRIGGVDGVPTGVLLVGDPRDRRAREDLARLLASAGLPVPVLGTVAYDPKAVKVLRTSSERAVRRTLWHRSLVDVVPEIQTLVDSRVPFWSEEVG